MSNRDGITLAGPGPTARVSVYIGSKDWPGALPGEALLADFELPEDETEDLRREAENCLVVDRPIGFIVKETRSHASWGADSGEVVQLVLFIASSAVSGAIGNAFYDFLRMLARREEKGGSAPAHAQTMTRDEAVERARWWIWSHYSPNADGLDPAPERDEDLTVVGEAEDKASGGWKISFRDAVGATYHVEIGLVKDLPCLVRIGRDVGEG